MGGLASTGGRSLELLANSPFARHTDRDLADGMSSQFAWLPKARINNASTEVYAMLIDAGIVTTAVQLGPAQGLAV